MLQRCRMNVRIPLFKFSETCLVHGSFTKNRRAAAPGTIPAVCRYKPFFRGRNTVLVKGRFMLYIKNIDKLLKMMAAQPQSGIASPKTVGRFHRIYRRNSANSDVYCRRLTSKNFALFIKSNSALFAKISQKNNSLIVLCLN